MPATALPLRGRHHRSTRGQRLFVLNAVLSVLSVSSCAGSGEHVAQPAWRDALPSATRGGSFGASSPLLRAVLAHLRLFPHATALMALPSLWLVAEGGGAGTSSRRCSHGRVRHRGCAACSFACPGSCCAMCWRCGGTLCRSPPPACGLGPMHVTAVPADGAGWLWPWITTRQPGSACHQLRHWRVRARRYVHLPDEHHGATAAVRASVGPGGPPTERAHTSLGLVAAS